MTHSQRTLPYDTIVDLMPDTTGKVDVTTMLAIMQSMFGVTASMYFDENTTPLTGVTSTPKVLAPWDGVSYSDNIYAFSSTGVFRPRLPGLYWIAGQISFSGTSNGRFLFRVYKNGSPTRIAFKRTLGTAGDVGSASLIDYISDVAEGDEIDVRVSITNLPSGQVVPEQANLLLMKVR